MSSISPSQQQLNVELWLTAYDGNISYARQVLARGAQLNFQNNVVNGRTTLHNACINHHPAFVKFLLDNKANTNILDSGHHTPLHWACRYGSLPCAQHLVEAGCDTEIRNSNGDRAMEIAVRFGSTMIVKYLSTHSSNARSGKTSLRQVLSGESANPHQTSTGVADKPVRIELHSSGRSSATTGNSILKVRTDLCWVRNAVWEARSKWRDIGRALHLSEGTISAVHESEDGECLTKVIKMWMESDKATVPSLLEALEDKPVSRCDIANEIREQKGIEKVSLPETSSGSPTTLTDSHPQRINNPEGMVHHGGAHYSSQRCSLPPEKRMRYSSSGSGQ